MCFKETHPSIRDTYLLAYTLILYLRIFQILQEFQCCLIVRCQCTHTDVGLFVFLLRTDEGEMVSDPDWCLC